MAKRKTGATEFDAPKLKAPKSKKVAKPVEVVEVSPDVVPVPADPRESDPRSVPPLAVCPRCHSADVLQMRGGGQQGAKLVRWFKCRVCRRAFSVVTAFAGSSVAQA